MYNIYILFGGNIGDSIDTINKADKLLVKRIGKQIKCSSFYETEPWGFTDKNNFVNKIVVYETNLVASEILSIIHKIENKLGRERTSEQYSARTIDIDILFYDNEIINSENLQIPHPRIAERMFVLEPMFEIEPDFIHPETKKTIKELKKMCNDNLIVKKITNAF